MTTKPKRRRCPDVLRRRLIAVTCHGHDRGALSVFVAGVLPGVFIMLGLAVDGSRAIQATQHANAIAQEAARAGGQAVDPAAIAAGGQIAVTPSAAVAAAEAYLAAADVTGDVEVSDGRTLTVHVTIVQPTIFLGAIGKGSFELHGEATAELVPQ